MQNQHPASGCSSPWLRMQGAGRRLLFLSSWLMVLANPAYGRKGNEPIYQDPFDLAAGGASLTRASREGRVFSNPALLPQGGSFHRWIGGTFSLSINKESVDMAREISGASSQSESESEEGSEPLSNRMLDAAFEHPLAFGFSSSVGWITRAFGLALFERFEPDIRAREFSDTGVPEISLGADVYLGGAVGVPIPTAWRWLTLGLTAKYLKASEFEESVAFGPAAADEVGALQNQTSAGSLNTGMGLDAGMLMFFQGSSADFSLAAKVDDIGNTKFNGDGAAPKEFPQSVSVGTSVDFHTGADTLHLEADYRDITQAYEEELFKRVYLGAKVLLRTYVGLGAGYYHGNPSYGAEIDLVLLRLTFSTFTRELGDRPGVEPRKMYMISLGMGY